jgi:LysM repeat protein
MKSFPALLALGLMLGTGACASRGSIRTLAAKKHPTLESLATPTPAQTPVATPAARSVTVLKGDSLWRIARRELGHGILYGRIAQANAVVPPYIIHPGQKLSISGEGLTATALPKAQPTAAPKNEAKRYGWNKVPNRAFTVGEKLTFAVQYGAITAGYATLSIPEVVAEAGRPVYHILAEARSHPFFDRIFTVRDRIESYLDVDYLFPWRYEKHLSEGSYKADARYQYDQRAGRMREPDKGKDEPMPIGSQDVLSCFYLFRSLDMTVGSESTIRVSADDMKNYELKVDVLRKERISSLAGDFDCVVVQPHLSFQGVFQQKGEVYVWITDDERRLPVKVRSKIAIGSININLQDAEWVASAP